MLLGAGSTDGRPSVLQYSSPDLRSWRPDGVLVEQGPGGPGGTVWECPQLFGLDGAWVLVVSLWDERPQGVACAVGDYDGHRFTPRSWQRLAADPLYAPTTFADAAGRRCALAWVQESGPVDAGWAGALSVPWLLTRTGDRVVVAPHPDVDSLRTGVLRADTTPLPPYLDVELDADPGVALSLEEAGRPLVTVAVGDDVRLDVPGQPDVAVPAEPGADGAVRVRLLVDVGVVELFTGGRVVAARTEACVAPTLRVWSAHRPRAMTVHSMAPSVG
jgi:beta-fructofuranosidase